MGAVPEWAPKRENHLLRSTSIVTGIEYAPGRVAWTTFDADATETLRLASRPDERGGRRGAPWRRREPPRRAEGFVVRPLAGGGVVVRVRHRSPGEVVVVDGAAHGSR